MFTEPETIDSSRMTVLSEVGCVDEIAENITDYYLGILDDFFVVRVRGETGNTVGAAFFERSNYAEVLRLIEKIYEGESELSLRKGKDYIIVALMSSMPHTATRPVERLLIKNARRAKLDNLQLGSFDVTASLETGKKLLSEMKRIESQVIG